MRGAGRHTGDWTRLRATLRAAARDARTSMRQALLREAVRLADTIKINITQGGRLVGKPFAPNAPATVRRKKSSAPLIDTGDLRNAVAAHRLGPDKVLVGIPGALRAFAAKRSDRTNTVGTFIAQYARVHEYGAVRTTRNGTTVWIPPRPFIRPAVDFTRQKRHRAWREELRELFR